MLGWFLHSESFRVGYTAEQIETGSRIIEPVWNGNDKVREDAADAKPPSNRTRVALKQLCGKHAPCARVGLLIELVWRQKPVTRTGQLTFLLIARFVSALF